MIRSWLRSPAGAHFARSAVNPLAFHPRNTSPSPANKTKPPRQPENPFSTPQSPFLPSPAHYFLTERTHRSFFPVTPPLHRRNTRSLPAAAGHSSFPSPAPHPHPSLIRLTHPST